MFMYPIQIHAYLWHYLVHRSLFSGEMDIKTQTSNSLSLAHAPSLSWPECKTKFKLNDAERMNKSLPNTNRNHLWILQIAISKVKRTKLWMLDSNVRNETFLVQKLWIKRGNRRDDWDSDMAHVVYVSPFNQNIGGKRENYFRFSLNY